MCAEIVIKVTVVVFANSMNTLNRARYFFQIHANATFTGGHKTNTYNISAASIYSSYVTGVFLEVHKIIFS